MMAGQSTNYGLLKPTPEEFYDIEVQNGNMDLIDAALKNVDDKAERAFQSASNGKSAIKTAITGVDPDIVIPTDATFTQLASAIGQIETGVKTEDATAKAGDILAPETAYVNGVKVTGTIPSKAAMSYTPSTTDRIIEAGQYLAGIQTIVGDPDLISANIKKGVTIFNRVGTCQEAALNVFVGANPPATYEGIWIQTEEAITSIINDIELWFANKWNDTSLMTYANMPFSPGSNRPAIAAVGTNLYLFGRNAGQSFKYDTIANTWISISNLPYPAQGITAVAIGTDIYVMGGQADSSIYYNKAYKYDTLTDSWAQLPNMTYNASFHAAAVVGTDVYIIGGLSTSGSYSGQIQKYNTLTNAWSQGRYAIPNGMAYHTASPYGTYIFIIGGANSTGNKLDICRYDTTTDTLVYLTPPFVANPTLHTAVRVGAYFMIMGGSSSPTKSTRYDPSTNTIMDMPDVPYSAVYHVAAYANNAIHVMGSNQSGHTTDNRRYNFTSKQYPDGTVVLHKVHDYLGSLRVELVSPAVRPFGLNTRFLTGLDNVYMYINGSLQENLPTYYGNGSSWVKFKG